MNRALLRGRDFKVEAELSAGLFRYLLGLALVVGVVGLFDRELFPENHQRILVLRYAILLPSLGILAILCRSVKTEHAVQKLVLCFLLVPGALLGLVVFFSNAREPGERVHFIALFLILLSINFVQSWRPTIWIPSAAWVTCLFVVGIVDDIRNIQSVDLVFAIFAFAAACGAVLSVRYRSRRELRTRRRIEELETASITDPLTGAYNRRLIEAVFGIEVRRAKELGRLSLPYKGLCLVLVDIDNFKSVNDHLGHETGDALLRMVVDTFRGTLFNRDVIFRLGGDEFLLVMPNTSAQEAIQAVRSAETKAILEFCSAFGIDTSPIAISVGAAVFPTDGTELQQLVELADSRMYDTKGRSPRSVRTELAFRDS